MKKVLLGIFILGVICLIGIVFVVFTRMKDKNDTGGTNDNSSNNTATAEVKFSSGGFGEADISYPGANQKTTSDNITVPDQMKQLVNTKQWKRYVTSDTKETITTYYDTKMASLNYSKGATKEPGILVYTSSDTRFFIYIVEGASENNIIVGLGKE